MFNKISKDTQDSNHCKLNELGHKNPGASSYLELAGKIDFERFTEYIQQN